MATSSMAVASAARAALQAPSRGRSPAPLAAHPRRPAPRAAKIPSHPGFPSPAGRVLPVAPAWRAASPRRPVTTAALSAEAEGALTLIGNDIVEEMKGINVYVVGDDDAANKQLAEILAKALGYAALSTPALVEQLSGGESLESVTEAEGIAEAVVAEVQVMTEVCQFVRCSVALWGGGQGMAARGDCWRYLFGGVCVWLDTGGDQDAPQREAYSLAELQIAVENVDDDSLAAAAEEVLKGVKQMHDGDDKLLGKKSFYVRMGNRGDWPNIQPPSWNPDKPDENTSEMYDNMPGA